MHKDLKKAPDSDLFKDLFNFDLKIRVFDEVYAYLIFQSLLKNFILVAFVYQKLLHGETSKKCSMIKEFSLFLILW